MTNPQNPDDMIAVKVGQLFIDMNKKIQRELADGIENLKELERLEDYNGEYFMLYSPLRSNIVSITFL